MEHKNYAMLSALKAEKSIILQYFKGGIPNE